MTDRELKAGAGASGVLGRCVLALVLVAVLVFAGSAHAATTHVFASNFGSAGSGDGQLSLAASSGSAVNATSHVVYVADTNNARVVEFGADGSFVRAFGADVGGAGVDVCTTGCVAGTPGTAAGEFTTPTFIAIDNSGGPSDGDVYVGDTTNNVVQKFAANGTLIAAWGFGGVLDGSTATGGPFGPLAGIAVDATGNLFVYDTNANMFSFGQDGTYTTTFNTTFGVSPVGIAADSTGNLYIVRGTPFVEKISPAGADLGTVDSCGCATGLALDTSDDHVYVAHGNSILEFTATGSQADSFGSGALTAAAGLAVDPTTGRVLAVDPGAGQITAFTPQLVYNPPTHVFKTAFGAPGSGDGQLGLVDNRSSLGGSSTLARRSSTGDLYVADTTNNRVVQFDATGTFIRAWGWGVADGSPALQTCTSGCQAGLPGRGAGQFDMPELIAVDNSSGPSQGDVYVGYGFGGDTLPVIQKYSSSGAYLDTIDSTTTPSFNTGLMGIQVDGAGHLWALVAGSQLAGKDHSAHTFEFDPSGAMIGGFQFGRGGEIGGMAIDSTGNFYFGDGYKVNSSGAYLGQVRFGLRLIYNSVPGFYGGPAVDLGTDDVYYADGLHLLRFPASCDVRLNFPCTPREDFGTGDVADAVEAAVDSSSDTIYVTDAGSDQIKVFVPTPALSTGAFSDRTSTGATLTGTVDPRTTAITDCHFQYVDHADYHAGDPDPYAAGQTAPCVPAPGSGNGAVAVHADLSGLTPGVAYDYRLDAVNANGTSGGADEVIPSGPPTIDAVSVSDVSADSAELRARVNPNGGDTRLHFEYVDDTTFRSSGFTNAVVTPDIDLGAGFDPADGTRRLQGLQANATYHYRAVATNSLGTTTGAEHAFTSQTLATDAADACPNAALRLRQTSAFLPDCRAYEQVSPVDKNGSEALVTVDKAFQAAAGGGSFAYTASQAYGDAQTGTTVDQTYLAARSSSGWTSHALVPRQQNGLFLPTVVFSAFSDDLSHATLNNGGGQDAQDDPPLVPGEPANNDNLFVRDNTNDTWQLANVTPANTASAETVFRGASPDLSNVVFTERAQLTPDAPAPSGDLDVNLYHWSNGTVHLVGIDPDGHAFPGSARADLAEDKFDPASPSYRPADPHAVSEDGSRIFFRAAGALYVRKDDAVTVQLDAPQGGSGPGGGGGLAVASTDGAHAFFTDDAAAGLTSDTVSGSGANLYRFDTANGTLTDLTPTADAGVVGVVGASHDGSYLYFVANGDLDGPGPASAGNCATDPDDPATGECSLYMVHDGTTTFVARLSGSDDGATWNGARQGPVSFNNAAAVSPDGTYLAFQSSRPLTGYDNTAANGRSCGKAFNDTDDLGPACPEVFLYHAPTGEVSCASCRPSGDAPQAMSTITRPPGEEDGQVLAHPSPRAISNSGRVFFNSLDKLLAGDTNHTYDVYEFEPDLAGDCRRAAGCLALISSGQSAQNALFRDASVDGSDIFFTTNDPLVAQDGDRGSDVYDARVGGGIASQNPLAPTSCQGAACQGPSSAPPPPPSAATVMFTGPGDAVRRPASTAGKVKVIGHPAKGASFLVTVKVPRAGRITITGAGVSAARKSVSKPGTYRLRVTLTAKEKRVLKRRHTLKLRLRVAFAPAGGGASHVSFSITDKA
ncbi:hypothetical protein [Baekduia sp.]|jgi:hypothetical protein|uniref:hypothetical protein n=1 Tax=Baekduia sp. TaxID=2600305 RepID=UPI002DFFC591|nr:hypothetical protein [Baekduia sp.]